MGVFFSVAFSLAPFLKWVSSLAPFFSAIYAISVILMIPHVKGTFNGYPRIQNVINSMRKHCYKFLGLYLPLRSVILTLAFVFFPILVFFHAIDQTSTSAIDMLKRTINVDIVELKTKPVSFLKGKVVRIRNGILIFRDYDNNETVLMPMSEFRNIKYDVVDTTLIAKDKVISVLPRANSRTK